MGISPEGNEKQKPDISTKKIKPTENEIIGKNSNCITIGLSFDLSPDGTKSKTK